MERIACGPWLYAELVQRLIDCDRCLAILIRDHGRVSLAVSRKGDARSLELTLCLDRNARQAGRPIAVRLGLRNLRREPRRTQPRAVPKRNAYCIADCELGRRTCNLRYGEQQHGGTGGWIHNVSFSC